MSDAFPYQTTSFSGTAGKTGRVNSDFTQANGIARCLPGVPLLVAARADIR
jgi:hypothetical protein